MNGNLRVNEITTGKKSLLQLVSFNALYCLPKEIDESKQLNEDANNRKLYKYEYNPKKETNSASNLVFPCKEDYSFAKSND